MNAIELGQAVRRKRQAERLSLRNVGTHLHLSPTTLSRVERGIGIPDSATLLRLSDWLCLPVRELAGVRPVDSRSVVYHPQASTPDIIAAHIRADVNLESDKATMLIDLFRAMYERMTV